MKYLSGTLNAVVNDSISENGRLPAIAKHAVYETAIDELDESYCFGSKRDLCFKSTLCQPLTE